MIGRRGEKQFSLLCSEAGVTCNSSHEDDYGWDMHVEFSPRPRPLIALDMQPGQASALVQVKATTGESRRITISLENALRYARSPLPTFILLVVLTDDKPRYFIKHVWLEQIAAFLKAGRVADAEGRTDANHIDVGVAFSAEDEHSEDLLAWIEAKIESVARPYAASKAYIVDTVGFGPTYGIAHATVRLDDPEHFLDLQLGLRTEVAASRFTYHSERFGILSGKPEIDAVDVRLSMTPEGRDAALRLEFPDGGVSVVRAKLYHAEHADVHEYRIATRTLDLVFGDKGRIKVRAHLGSDERMPIEDLDLFARLQAVERGVAIPLLVDTGETPFEVGSIKMHDVQEKPGLGWLVLALEALRKIAAAASRDISDMATDDLDVSAGGLEIVGALASDRLMRLDFAPEPGVPDKFEAFLGYAYVTVADVVFATVVQREIIADRTDGTRRQIGLGPAKMLVGMVLGSDKWSPGLIEAQYNRHLERLSPVGDILAMGNIADVVGGPSVDRVLKSDLPTGRRAPGPRREKSPNLRN